MALTEAVGTLMAAFERIAATRMAGLPMNNPALHVAAVGFRPWQEEYLAGVLITPWTINLMLLGDKTSNDLHLTADCRRTWDFPSGSYDFMGGEEPECGAFQFCSLFSPAFEFSDQATAEATGREIMDALLVGVPTGVVDEREAARFSGRSVMNVQTSRRVFLQGLFGAQKA